MAEAARDHDNYQAFARFHTSLEDMLRWSMPVALANWCRALFRSNGDIKSAAEILIVQGVRLARTTENPRIRAICEVLLFELIRVGLILEAELDESGILSYGSGDIARSVIAEDEVLRWLDDPLLDERGVLELMMTTAMANQVAQAANLHRAVSLVQQSVLDAQAAEIRLNQRLNALDVADALLLRNAHADLFEEQQLSHKQLRDRHNAVFASLSENGMSQRLHRTKAKLMVGGVEAAKRQPLAIIDFAREAARAEEQRGVS